MKLALKTALALGAFTIGSTTLGCDNDGPTLDGSSDNGGPTLDGSSQEALEASFAEMLEDMSDEEAEAFSMALEAILMANAGDEATALGDLSEEAEREILEVFDGMSADEVLAMGEELGASGAGGEPSVGNPGYGGYYSLTITGGDAEAEGEFEGWATYTDNSLEAGHLSLTIGSGPSGVQLSLSTGIEDETPPPPGTYPIGEGGFHGTFRDQEGGGMFDGTEYTLTSGTVEIDSSSAEEVQGTFEFEANERREGDGTVSAEGEFHALQVEGAM